ncbi:unnamed protein product [Microthlaspi erraticum]|uniref:Peptidase A1 domain-containing protein n=1 Tax=Microthlaspi erraticum TaxID=1685480 RepID=A0A6D2I7W9_9BRAS|nr:unnamed protein product [Microthlaspi erraticum]
MIMDFSLQIIITCLLLITATASSSSPPPGGFTTDLIHRRRSNSSSRPSNVNDGSSPYANTVFDTYEYLIKIQVGTPPVEIQAVLDTGSDQIWTQCLPCLSCYNQEAPIFDSSKSSTYKPRRCDSTPDHSCPYQAIYADNSYSFGTLASETVTIQSSSGQPFVMPETLIGCGNNSGLKPTFSGVVGLGRGSSSLISQMGEDFLGIFSYCFSGKGTSKINFGSNAIVAGDGTVATDMFQKSNNPDFYYLNLDAISVNDNRVETLGTSFHALDGNIIIDSGTTYTYLPDSYCSQVKDAVSSVVQAEQVPFSESNMLCYSTDNLDLFPVITMHFSGGADLVLDKYNMYVTTGGVTCLAIQCVGPTQYAFFGNRAQNNFLVGYDSSSELVSFKATDCSSLWS